jgi:minichromosome maintenance protein 10
MYSRAFVKRTLMSEKKRKVDHSGQRSSHSGTSTSSTSVPLLAPGTRIMTARPAGKGTVTTGQYYKPAPSNLISKLSKISRGPPTHELAKPIQRSYSLLARPNPETSLASSSQIDAAPPIATQPAPDMVQNRDDRLAIIEQLEVGPIDHKPPHDDPHFGRLEPNSGIRLSYVLSLQLKLLVDPNAACRSRSLSHDDLQEYLRGRYYLSPSKFYSCIRLLPNQSGYDVPVDGDWVTIAVVAERGPVRATRSPVDAAPGEDGRAADDAANRKDQKTGNSSRTQDLQKHKAPRSHGKKYVNMKLIDFGARSRPSSAGGASIRGDAFLTLLLFEADSFDRVTNENGTVKKVYTGGSKGAFEAMSKLKEGDVIALLNPKVLKPFQVSLHE